jgi:hypothetical protein
MQHCKWKSFKDYDTNDSFRYSVWKCRVTVTKVWPNFLLRVIVFKLLPPWWYHALPILSWLILSP